MREGKGLEKGELLIIEARYSITILPRWADLAAEEKESMTYWDGSWFGRARDNEGNFADVPEAHLTLDNTLPHLHTEICDHVPSAKACPALCEEAMTEDKSLEEESARIGMGVQPEQPHKEGSRQCSVHQCGNKRPPPDKGFVRLQVVEVEVSENEEGAKTRASSNGLPHKWMHCENDARE